MQEREPRQTRFDVRFSLVGVSFRIHPLYWGSSAILGIRYVADPEDGGVAYFGFWMVAVLASGVLHGLGQCLMGRFFGIRGKVVLHGLGSSVFGLGELPRLWQRLAVLFAGPLVQGMIVVGVWGMTVIPFPDSLRESGWATEIATGATILVRINLYWGLLNLLPIWSLDGGRGAVEVGSALFGRLGFVGGLILSILTCGLLAVWIIAQMSARSQYPYDPHYFLDQQRFSVWLLFAFLFWLRGFLALWPDHSSPVIEEKGRK